MRDRVLAALLVAASAFVSSMAIVGIVTGWPWQLVGLIVAIMAGLLAYAIDAMTEGR